MCFNVYKNAIFFGNCFIKLLAIDIYSRYWKFVIIFWDILVNLFPSNLNILSYFMTKISAGNLCSSLYPMLSSKIYSKFILVYKNVSN